MKIQLNNLTANEQAFVKAAVNEFNDLMWTDQLGHGIPKTSLGGVVGSLVKKGIIYDYSNDGDPRDKGIFEFCGEDGEPDNQNRPELVEA